MLSPEQLYANLTELILQCERCGWSCRSADWLWLLTQHALHACVQAKEAT